MSQTTRPSLYPNANQQSSSDLYPPAPPPPSSSLGASPYDYDQASAPPPTSSGDALHEGKYETTLPPEYELLIEIEARVTEQPPASGSAATRLTEPKLGKLRVVQGPLPPSSPEAQTPSYHAFLSIDDVNIPMLSTFGASRRSEHSFYVTIPSGTFLIEIDKRTPKELVEGFESLLKWFCQWQVVSDSGVPSTLRPQGVTLNENNEVIFDTHGENELKPKKSSVDYLNRAGDKGVAMVERVGSRINQKINNHLERHKSKVIEEQQQGIKTGKQLRLGGKVTNSLLSTTRRVVGSGAEIASKVTDRISTGVSNAVTGNKVSRSMATAPEGSMKRKFYDNLTAGALVFGRLYVETDRQSKIIISDAGDRMSEIANHKYGSEAEMAARNLSGIVLDGYRISRFPEKLGATSLVKGAFKSRYAQDSHFTAVNEGPASNAGPVERHPHSYVAHQRSMRQAEQAQRAHNDNGVYGFNDISEGSNMDERR